MQIKIFYVKRFQFRKIYLDCIASREEVAKVQ